MFAAMKLELVLLVVRQSVNIVKKIYVKNVLVTKMVRLVIIEQYIVITVGKLVKNTDQKLNNFMMNVVYYTKNGKINVRSD